MIRTEDYTGDVRIAGLPPEKRELEAEVMALEHLVSDFSIEMVRKLAIKCAEGRRGWDNPDLYASIESALLKAATRGKWVSVANFAAMLWNMDSGKGETNEEH